MSSDVVVSLDHVSKLFYKQEQRTMKELIPALFRGGKGGNWFWALQDISLQVKLRGTLGIVGSNGSGKSTLLKLIAGVTRTTEGNVVKGKNCSTRAWSWFSCRTLEEKTPILMVSFLE